MKLTNNPDGTLVFEDAQIMYRNFEGREGQYNREGDRNFAVILDEDTARKMAEDGWNVKTQKTRDDETVPKKYLSVTVGFPRPGKKNTPPRLWLITYKGRTMLGEEECDVMDWVDVAKVDLIVRPYSWAVSGNTGLKPYLKSLWLTVQEDILEQKYRELPEIRNGQIAIEPRYSSDYIDAEVIEDQLAIGNRVEDPPWTE